MKFPNQEYKMVFRHGYFVDKNTIRKEHDAAVIVAFVIGAAVMLIVVAIIFQSCAMTGGVR